MKRQTTIQAAAYCVNTLIISSVLLILFGFAWECSTRWYLSGFSDAVLPSTSSPEQKVAAILAWMEHGPARATQYYSDDNEDRDPIDTLNYRELLSVCGTATNAFVNLASAGGIEARRLLLLDTQGLNTNHVVAEVHMDGRWVIVDPAFHAVLTDGNGRFLTRQELASPAVLKMATRNLPGYDPAYNYEHTAFIHFARIPLVGRFLQTKMNSVFPVWQERINLTVLVERQSYDTLIAGMLFLCVALLFRRCIFWYGRKHGIQPMSCWEQIRQGGLALFSALPSGIAEKSYPTV